MSTVVAKTDKWTPRIAAILNRLVYALAKHWLLLVNTMVGLYTALPVLAPALMATGHSSAARLIYAFFRLSCHQLPERSFFLFGPQWAYQLDELERLIGPNVPLSYIGSPALGYKVAVCERDMAVYLAVWVAGMAFALFRHRWQPLPMRVFVLLCIPMAVDGLGQLVGLWESSWWVRVATGAAFGIACVWLAYPHIEKGMNDMLRVVTHSRG